MKTLQAFEREPVDGRDVVVVKQEVVELAEALERAPTFLETAQIGYFVAAQVTERFPPKINIISNLQTPWPMKT